MKVCVNRKVLTTEDGIKIEPNRRINTTTVVHFLGAYWYVIGTQNTVVTLLAKKQYWNDTPFLASIMFEKDQEVFVREPGELVFLRKEDNIIAFEKYDINDYLISNIRATLGIMFTVLTDEIKEMFVSPELHVKNRLLEDQIFLLDANEVKRLSMGLRAYSTYWWTRTECSFNKEKAIAVSPTGELKAFQIGREYALRPAMMVDISKAKLQQKGRYIRILTE